VEAGEAAAAESAATEPAAASKSNGKPRTNTWELLHKFPAERGPSRMGRKKPK
jgi:hypothetical protein